jgi:ATP-dependent helicase HrpA
MANESVAIFGIPLAANRSIQYARVDADYARELLIRHALVGGEWETHHTFVAHNAAVVEEVHALEARLRRGDLLVGEDEISDWFDRRVPDDITDVRRFDRWWKKTRERTPDLLDMSLADLLAPDLDDIDDSGFPEVWHHRDLDLHVAYELDPTSHLDGMNIDVPLGALNRIDPAPFDWLVPGLRRELITELIRTLPKALRKQFVPVAETVDAVLTRLDPDGAPLLEQLSRELSRQESVVVPVDSFAIDRIPAHLRPTFRVVDERGVIIADGHDIEALRELLAEDLRASLSASTHGIERRGLTDWDFGELPRVVETDAPGHVVRAYPALVDEGDTVGVRLLATAEEQADAMWLGTRRLLLLNRPSVSKQLRAVLTDDVKLALVTSPYASPSAWFDDCLAAAVDAIMIDAGAPVWNAVDYERLRVAVRDRLPRVVTDVAKGSAAILAERRVIEVALYDLTAPQFADASTDMASQLASLTYPGFVTGVGADRLVDVRRYLWGIERRIEALPERVAKDRESMLRCRSLEAQWDRAVEARGLTPELEDAAWMLQELRISVFAQSLGTKGTVSEKRIRALLG